MFILSNANAISNAKLCYTNANAKPGLSYEGGNICAQKFELTQTLTKVVPRTITGYGRQLKSFLCQTVLLAVFFIKDESKLFSDHSPRKLIQINHATFDTMEYMSISCQYL